MHTAPKASRSRTKRVAVNDTGVRIAISVIVPVKNGLPWLHSQLRALLSQECSSPWEIVVADNASTDGTSKVVQDYACKHPWLRLVDASSVTGPGAHTELWRAGCVW